MRLMPVALLCLTFPLSADTLSEQQVDLEKKTLFFGEDNREKVTDTNEWPWQAIGQIKTASGNLCTATLISPNIVLTAGHCVITPPKTLDKAVALHFVVKGATWKYEETDLETFVDINLSQRLISDSGRWIVPPKAAPYDYALIRLKNHSPPIEPIPMWRDSEEELVTALMHSGNNVTQAGYPEDHVSALYRHSQCKITGWPLAGVLSHRCDTLPGDSGSPLMLNSPENRWMVIAIQSSAPMVKDRYIADNHAISVTTIKAELQKLMVESQKP